MLENLFKNRKALFMISLGFLLISQSLIYTSGSSEKAPEEDSDTDESPYAILMSEDMTRIKAAIDKYFTEINPNMEEKIIKTVNMSLKRDTGMIIELVLDRDLVKKAIMGAYFFYDDDKQLVIEFIPENTVLSKPSILVDSENLKKISIYVLSKIFEYDTVRDSFKISDPSASNAYKGLGSHIKSITMNDNPQAFTDQRGFYGVIQFFESLNKTEEEFPNIPMWKTKEEASANFLIDWEALGSQNNISPAILGYYDKIVFTDGDPFKTLIQKIYILEKINYPLNTENDIYSHYTKINMASIFQKREGAWDIVEEEDQPEILSANILKELSPSLIEAYIIKIIYNMTYEPTVHKTGDLKFRFSISTDNLIKSVGFKGKYKGRSPAD